MISVADLGVQFGEFILVFGEDFRTATQPGFDDRRRDRTHQIPFLSAGVRTGASQRWCSSSSILSKVIDVPAISRLVMYEPTRFRVTFKPARLSNLRGLAIDDEKLDQWRAAQPVDKHQHFVAGLEREVVQDWLHQEFHDLVRGSQLGALAPWFAMNSDADFHFVFRQVEGRLADVRHGARGQGHAHAAGLRVDPLAKIANRLERTPVFRRGAAKLFRQHRGTDAAPSGRPCAILHGDIVVDDHAFDREFLRPAPFRRRARNS